MFAKIRKLKCRSQENYAYIVLDHAYLAIASGIAIMLLVLAFMMIGNALRNAMDVKG